jgi:hypothetical protein
MVEQSSSHNGRKEAEKKAERKGTRQDIAPKTFSKGLTSYFSPSPNNAIIV